jgi:hypothetical protein
MPALDFPSSPTLGQVYSAANKTWTWDGSKWIISQYDKAANTEVTDYINEKFEEAVSFAIFFS